MTEKENDRFAEHFCQQGDLLDNAVHQMLETISGTDLEWNIADIRDVLDYAIGVLGKKNIQVCDPYYESSGERESQPCYLIKDNGCDKSWCPMLHDSTHITEAGKNMEERHEY